MDIDKKNFDLLVEKYNYIVEHIVQKFCKNNDYKKDLIAEIWHKVYFSLDHLQKKETFPKWLSKIAQNHCIDYLRKKCSISTISDDKVEEKKCLNSSNEVDKELLDDERNKLLFDTIRSLPKEDMLIIILYYIDGFSIKILSEKLHMSKSAIKVKLHRAREKIRNILKNKGYF